MWIVLYILFCVYLRPSADSLVNDLGLLYLKLKTKNDGLKPIAQIPLGGDNAIYFDTDVEDHYFDRVEEPGSMRIALLGFKSNNSEGGNKPGSVEEIEDVFNVNISSPHEGTIKVNFNPTKKVDVGDAIQIKATLNGAGENFDEIFWVKVSDRKAPQQPSKKDQLSQVPDLGSPQYILAYENDQQGEKNTIAWDQLEAAGVPMSRPTVVYPTIATEALLHETGSAVLAPWVFGLRFLGDRIGLGFGQRAQSVKHRTTHPCFGLLVG